ncbi:uncharacterized protein NESG_01999 [Nematocida ausubeli]|uniref:Uncharacterized protein n=1 Tax=Nematocida ausubeli (strain ATCC PRA-371 / ERTm2) TaxID=1913371 RepID=A0A086IZB2_NEMA1|nr:uncharacterized protein NESG_01999 [Nematocida ausubeli]KFG25230.1 hypothetical protein NESG_01999 [Nematocida ausubeli]
MHENHENSNEAIRKPNIKGFLNRHAVVITMVAMNVLVLLATEQLNIIRYKHMEKLNDFLNVTSEVFENDPEVVDFDTIIDHLDIGHKMKNIGMAIGACFSLIVTLSLKNKKKLMNFFTTAIQMLPGAMSGFVLMCVLLNYFDVSPMAYHFWAMNLIIGMCSGLINFLFLVLINERFSAEPNRTRKLINCSALLLVSTTICKLFLYFIFNNASNNGLAIVSFGLFLLCTVITYFLYIPAGKQLLRKYFTEPGNPPNNRNPLITPSISVYNPDTTLVPGKSTSIFDNPVKLKWKNPEHILLIIWCISAIILRNGYFTTDIISFIEHIALMHPYMFLLFPLISAGIYFFISRFNSGYIGVQVYFLYIIHLFCLLGVFLLGYINTSYIRDIIVAVDFITFHLSISLILPVIPLLLGHTVSSPFTIGIFLMVLHGMDAFMESFTYYIMESKLIRVIVLIFSLFSCVLVIPVIKTVIEQEKTENDSGFLNSFWREPSIGGSVLELSELSVTPRELSVTSRETQESELFGL